MNEKKDREIDEKSKAEVPQDRSADPGRTPGQAEGTEQDVNEALRREERKKEH